MDRVAVYLIYDRAIDEEVLDALAACHLERYTRWHDASGVGANGPHLGDAVWPALNNVLLAVVPAEQQGEILERVRALQNEFPYVGLRAFVVPVLEMI
jgi:hypothetical protein